MITGKMLRDSVISAANNIGNKKSAVDALNVFPVPDGDTGSNMSMTMAAAAREAASISDDATVGEVSDRIASALLRGARGNSGVILSLIFRGMSKGFKGCEYATGITMAKALSAGSERAYKAVMKPTEGTILTVIRQGAKKAEEAAKTEDSAVNVFEAALKEAKETLKKTPELLPVLKKAKVVDAGGQGLVYVFEGMLSFFRTGEIIKSSESGENSGVQRAEYGGEDIVFCYCTEFLINKKDGTPLDALTLRAYLETVGDCIVAVDDKDIIKVHVHTNCPGEVITKALEIGELVNIKIENMRHQHKNASWGAVPEKEKEEQPAVIAGPEKKYGFAAVAAGDGIREMFTELGADSVINGGQTMNPSTEDILRAVNSVPAECVFVLPNNKNIIMTAEQAAPLTDKKVIVIQTKTIPQGMSAMLAFDEDAGEEENSVNMTKAAGSVGTVQVTFAARDSVVGNQTVKKGDIMALENGKITEISKDPVQAAYRAARRLAKKSASVITVFYGEGVTEEQSEELCEKLRQKLPQDVEIMSVNGGQPIYYYIISIE